MPSAPNGRAASSADKGSSSDGSKVAALPRAMELVDAANNRAAALRFSASVGRGGASEVRPEPSRHPSDVEDMTLPKWENLPGAALNVITEALDMLDFKNTRLVCKPWMLACRCRRLRLTLSCMEHEHLWKRNPSWLAHLVERSHLQVVRLRLQQVPLGHGRTRPLDMDTLPSSMGKLAEMVEQVPLALEEVQLTLHPLAKEGLDNAPNLSPAWTACIARMAQYTPRTPHQHQHQHLHHRSERQAAACSARRVKLDATALQQGYCGNPGSACLCAGVLQQLAAQVPGMSSVSLSLRTSSPAAAAALAAMPALRALRLQYEETLSPGVGAVSGAVAAGVDAAPAATSSPGLPGGSRSDSFSSSFLFPLTSLQHLKHLSMSMSFPSFGPSASHFRRGSSAWCLQLLPSFPQLRQLELTLVLQDAAAILACRRASGTHAWHFGGALPSGSLQQLQRATIRVRGYASKDAACGRVLEALVRQLTAVPALRHFTLALCTSQADLQVPAGVWAALLQQPTLEGLGGPPVPRFAAALEFSSESSHFAAFGLPSPLPLDDAGGGQLLLPLEELRQQHDAHASTQLRAREAREAAPQALRLPACSLSSGSGPSPNDVPASAAASASRNFPLSALRVTRSPHTSSLPTHLLGRHHLLLLPQHLSLLASLSSLTELHLEYQVAALEPWVQVQVQDACIRGMRSGATAAKCPAPTPWTQVQGGAPMGGAGRNGVHAVREEERAWDEGRGACGREEVQMPEEREVEGQGVRSSASSSASSTNTSFSACSSGSSGSGGSCLLWLTQSLPRLTSLYLRSFGTQFVGSESLIPHRIASATGGAVGVAAEDLEMPGFQGYAFLGESIGSCFAEVGGRPVMGVQDTLHGRDATANVGWLRFDNEVAEAAAAAWGSQMTEMQLIGLDMQGLTAEGLAALESMPLLTCLSLTKSPAKSCSRGGALSRQASLGSTMPSPSSSY